jgi:hypothetical protein
MGLTMKKILFRGSALITLLVLLVACHSRIPMEALQLSPRSLAQRQMQTRRFDTQDEKKVLAACAAVLQDLGFQLDQSETRLGLVVASKTRSAVSAGQVVGAIFLAALTGSVVPTDKDQKMRACLVTCPSTGNKQGIAVRVTFQRIVWNTQGQVTRREGLNDPKIYQEFFDKLSKSLFLEANDI